MLLFPDEPQYFVDFTILNHNLGDKPVKAMLNEILVRVRRIWMNSGHIYVTKVLTLKEVGERLPVPEDPGDVLIKEGYLRILSYSVYHNSFLNIQEAKLYFVGDKCFDTRAPRSYQEFVETFIVLSSPKRWPLINRPLYLKIGVILLLYSFLFVRWEADPVAHPPLVPEGFVWPMVYL